MGIDEERGIEPNRKMDSTKRSNVNKITQYTVEGESAKRWGGKCGLSILVIVEDEKQLHFVIQ